MLHGCWNGMGNFSTQRLPDGALAVAMQVFWMAWHDESENETVGLDFPDVDVGTLGKLMARISRIMRALLSIYCMVAGRFLVAITGLFM